MGYASLIGKPYTEKNCWDIARDFYILEFGLELKQHAIDDPQDREFIQNLIYTNQGEFERVEVPKFGDLVLLKIAGIESHIGVYVGSGKLLHTLIATGCVIDRTDRWDKVIVGYFRLKVAA